MPEEPKPFTEFEIKIRELLQLQGWHVQDETISGHKKVDAIISKFGDFGNLVKYAVECKFHKNKLLQCDVSQIYSSYLPLIQNKDIDTLLLITENGLHPSAETYVANADRFIHIDRKSLEDNIINFKLYVNCLIQDYSTDRISKYYIPQCPKGIGIFFEDYIAKYACDTNVNPIAILGGYGTGKTSLARKLAAHLGQLYLNNKSNRIPVLVTLGNISSDQSLEGLLGKLFTSEDVIKNYSFRLFMTLNRLGRFVIILDGFDEMKRVMSWESLKFNLKELNRLICGESKVILLGRPTAFLDDSELQEALHGTKESRIGQQQIQDWPNFTELHIAPFSKTDMKQFAIKYYKSSDMSESNKIDLKKSLSDLIKAIDHGEGTLLDIISRPVQMKMLMDILPGYKNKLKNLTVSELYHNFFDSVCERESGKHARTRFKKDKRIEFMRNIALYMWKSNTIEIRSHQLPNDLIDTYCGKEDDRDAIKRDLIIGSILEAKNIDGFYFPHRSFQEYLVSEGLHKLALEKNDSFFEISNLTTEIREFFIDLIGKHKGSEFIEWAITKSGGTRESISRYRGDLFVELLDELCTHYKIQNPIARKKHPSKTQIIIMDTFIRAPKTKTTAGILHVSQKAAENKINETNGDKNKTNKHTQTIKRDYSRRR